MSTVTVEHILRNEVFPRPTDFAITYYFRGEYGSWKFKTLTIDRIELLTDAVRINNTTTVPLNRIYRVENHRRRELTFQQDLREVSPQQYIEYGSKVIEDETERFIAYPSSDATKHIQNLEFLRQSEISYDPNKDDKDETPSLGLRILLRLFESALPVDSLLGVLAGEERRQPTREYKFQILRKLDVLRGLGLVEYVMYDETERGGSYYTITKEGGGWVCKYIKDQISGEDIAPVITILGKYGSIRRQFFFIRIAHLWTRIDPLLFVRAIFATNESQKQGYASYLLKIEERPESEVATLMTEVSLTPKVRKLVEDGYITPNGEKTDKTKQALDRISLKITEVVNKLKMYRVVIESNDTIQVTFFGSKVFDLINKGIQDDLSPKPIKMLNFPAFGTSSFMDSLKSVRRIAPNQLLLGITIGLVSLAAGALIFQSTSLAVGFGLGAVLFAVIWMIRRNG